MVRLPEGSDSSRLEVMLLASSSNGTLSRLKLGVPMASGGHSELAKVLEGPKNPKSQNLNPQTLSLGAASIATAGAPHASCKLQAPHSDSDSRHPCKQYPKLRVPPPQVLEGAGAGRGLGAWAEGLHAGAITAFDVCPWDTLDVVTVGDDGAM